ncbi:MAG TPA: putative metal-dependent hydrolase [Thermoanaerobaculia bacterium]|nr:putative metal-dependent hydrolase [Thermoanaerobaculia bacterium]
MSDPRYPIGKFQRRDNLTPDERRTLIDQIAAVPQTMRNAVRGLSEQQLDTPYREGGWSLRQVVHHVPDSHLNAYVRIKLALTEDNPTIKPYDEDAWAKLADSRSTPVETSLQMIDALHTRWVALMRSMKDADFRRTFRHPEHKGDFSIDGLVSLYAWHGRHHTAHITAFRDRMGW